MRAVIQRVSQARVTVADAVVGEIARPGLVVLVGVTHSDTAATAMALASKIYNLRILAGQKSCADLAAPLLVISQFTLYGDTAKGRRPSWSAAAPSDVAAPLIEAFVAALTKLGASVATGEFGAVMAVELVNDGPVTLIVEVQDGAASDG